MRDQKEKKIIPFYTAVSLFYIRTRSRTLRNNTIVPHTRSSYVNTNLCSVFVLRRNYHAHKVNLRLLRQIDQDTPERGRWPAVFFSSFNVFSLPRNDAASRMCSRRSLKWILQFPVVRLRGTCAWISEIQRTISHSVEETTVRSTKQGAGTKLSYGNPGNARRQRNGGRNYFDIETSF